MIPTTILLVATNRWYASARVAMALAASGCRITACCLPGHPFEKTGVLARRFPISALHPIESVLSALHMEFPDLIVACDERGTHILHQLYARSSQPDSAGDVRELVRRSLGDPNYFVAASSRNTVLDRATALGIRIPVGGTLRSELGLEQWCEQFGFPAYLKADGTSGGVGVRRVNSLQQARKAYKKLHAPPIAARVFKRLLVDRDPILLLPFLKREKPAMSIQRAIDGEEATAAISCWNGQVLSTLCMQVLQRTEDRGPASVLRRIDNAEMERAAVLLVKSLGLSGLIGLDFMIERETGAAYLLELNLRATQTAHLCMGPQLAPAFALGRRLLGKSTRDVPQVGQTDVALFPQEWRRDPQSEYLASALHDVPMQAPELVRLALQQSRQKAELSVAEFLATVSNPVPACGGTVEVVA